MKKDDSLWRPLKRETWKKNKDGASEQVLWFSGGSLELQLQFSYGLRNRFIINFGTISVVLWYFAHMSSGMCFVKAQIQVPQLLRYYSHCGTCHIGVQIQAPKRFS